AARSFNGTVLPQHGWSQEEVVDVGGHDASMGPCFLSTDGYGGGEVMADIILLQWDRASSARMVTLGRATTTAMAGFNGTVLPQHGWCGQGRAAADRARASMGPCFLSTDGKNRVVATVDSS